MHGKWFCKDLDPFDVGEYSVERRYLLNIRSYKFCFETVPKNIEKHLVTLDDYFKNETSCEPFFIFVMVL